MKKTKTLAILVALGIFTSCGNKASDTNDNMTSESLSKDSVSYTETMSNDATNNRESSIEDTSSNEDMTSELEDSEKALIDEFVTNLEKAENGTAGATLKMDKIFTDFVNNAGFLEDKLKASKDYFLEKSNDVEDKENFDMSLEAIKSSIDMYEKDKDNYLSEIETSGSTWDPQVDMNTLKDFLDI